MPASVVGVGMPPHLGGVLLQRDEQAPLERIRPRQSEKKKKKTSDTKTIGEISSLQAVSHRVHNCTTHQIYS
jgi:hypothetical protein